jgi:threonine dehydrogenase-like Zn-dependent dehydrogenase
VNAGAMPAAVFEDVGRLAILERPKPRVERADDVVLAVEACGICGSDLQILSVPPGHPATPGVVLGHEFVGRVIDAGDDVVALEAGDRVVVAPNIACGQCRWCRRGLRIHCEHYTAHGVFVDGGLAPRVRVPASACHPISPELPPHLAALAEPLSTVVHGAQVADAFPGDTAVVLGAGPIGLMFTALLRLAGARVVAFEPAERRAALALAMGAERVVDPTTEDAAAAVRELTDGLGAGVVIDAVGSQLPAALEVVRKAGRIVLFGVNTRARAEIAQEHITRDELTVIGTFVGQDVFPTTVDLLERGAVDWSPLVSHRIALEELPGAVDELRAGRAVKVEVEFPAAE